MSTRRLQRMEKRRKQVFIQKLFLFMAAFIVVFCLSISLGSNFAEAQEDAGNVHTVRKYYKSIELRSGDTLWDIAREYMDENYDSIDDYIKELMEINGLTSDQIQEGRYLTVSYYR